MSQFERNGGDPSRRATRRTLLATGLGLTAAASLGACTPSDPRISSDGRLPAPSRASGSPATNPTVAAGLGPAAVAAEQGLADLAGGITAGPHRATLGSRKPLLTALREAHLQHVAALRSATPTTRPLPSGTPTPVPLPAAVAKLTLEASISRLATAEKVQAARLRKLAVAVTGLEALLAGSLAAAAGSYAAALPTRGPVPTHTAPAPHPATVALSDVAALQAMVTQLHAIVYGYQLALGQLPATSANGRRALAGLQHRRALRDHLEQVLTNRAAAVPAAAGAYVPPVAPTTAARSAELVRRMETALLPFCGLWLASATRSQDQTLALTTLTGTETIARSWGAPLTVWPGWQD